MAYDRLAESLRLIEVGITDDPLRLSRRRRFAAVAVDVDGDVACTWFVRCGAGGPLSETHLLARERGVWRLLGGGGGGHLDGGLADRQPADVLGHYVGVRGGGAVVRNADRLLPWAGQWVRDAELSVSREVAGVEVVGRRARPRRLRVPRHGHLVVVWATRRPPEVVAYDADGRRLATVSVADDVRMPIRYGSHWGHGRPAPR